MIPVWVLQILNQGPDAAANEVPMPLHGLCAGHCWMLHSSEQYCERDFTPFASQHRLCWEVFGATKTHGNSLGIDFGGNSILCHTLTRKNLTCHTINATSFGHDVTALLCSNFCHLQTWDQYPSPLAMG